MTEKVYKDVLFYGVLTSRTGNKFWLLKPDPVVRDSWQHDKQQRFLVVPYTEIGYDGDTLLYNYPRHFVTTDPDIEYISTDKLYKVVDLDVWEIPANAEPEGAGWQDEPMPDDVKELLITMELERANV